MSHRTVYIQQANGDWLTENCYVMAQGCKALGFTVVPFDIHGLQKLPLTKEDVVYGGINTTMKAFDMLGVKRPTLINAHRVLPAYMGRKVWETTVGEIRKNEAGAYPFFIKPLEDNKLFNGYVVNNPIFGLLKLKGLADDTKILASENMDFATEYRCFVHNGRVVDVRFYKGDPKQVIDFNQADMAVQNYVGQPISYTLDFGLDANGKPGAVNTHLIEINDGFGFGLYGLDFRKAIPMVFDRWDQIVGNPLVR